MNSAIPVSVRWEPILEEALRCAFERALHRVTKYDNEYPRLSEPQAERLRETLTHEFWVEFWERFRLEGEE